jgi:NADH-quinone oxidoreductase subunit J
MTWPFVILTAITLLTAIGAMAFRNLVHCALSLTGTFAALAGLYLHLNAQFVGLAQLLVYVGAVAVLIVFAILLTQGATTQERRSSAGAIFGLLLAVGFFVTLAAAILDSKVRNIPITTQPSVSVAKIGDQLLADYVLPLEVVGLLLTAAMIGGVLIALQERSPSQPNV